MTALPSDPPPEPGLRDLFLGFAGVAAFAFGGVLPWARFVLVEKRRWLSEEEFADTLALCQLLPGPNICNLSVAVGARFGGVPGVAASLGGLIALPFVVVLLLAGLYASFSTVPAVGGALAGMAAAAAGLVAGMAAKIAMPVLRRRFWVTAPVVLAIFAAVALGRVPLWAVLIVGAPVSIALGWRMR